MLWPYTRNAKPMLTIGMFGASDTSHLFVQAAYATNKFKLKHNVTYDETTFPFRDIFLHGTELPVHVVFIATNSAPHFEFIKLCLKDNISVILGKPATLSHAELDELCSTAKDRGTFLLEAYCNVYESGLRRSVRDLGTIFGASLTCATTRSYLRDNGHFGSSENPNPNKSNGSLMDVGIHAVALAVALFGKPHSQTYAPVMDQGTGLDIGGPMLLKYDNFTVQIDQSICYTSKNACEIYGESGTLAIDSLMDIGIIKLENLFFNCDPELAAVNPDGVKVAGTETEVKMQGMASEFAQIIIDNQRARAEEYRMLSHTVIDIIKDLKEQNGLTSP